MNLCFPGISLAFQYFINNSVDFVDVFQAMASTEDKAYEIMRELDVNYVLVIFGGLTGYSSDGKYRKTVSHTLVYRS